MNPRDENDIPPMKLLPFGGFEVASLLQQLKSGKRDRERFEGTGEFAMNAPSISSGWLHSKIMAG